MPSPYAFCTRRILLALGMMATATSCDGGATTPGPRNRPPEAVGSIPARRLAAGETAILAVSTYFRDPDGDALVLTASTSDAAVATAGTTADSVMVVAVSGGEAEVTVTARDPGGLSARQLFDVAVEASESEDRDALLALWEAAGGPEWANRDNWLTDEPLGEWHGVEVDAGDRVARLDLAGNNLMGTIPPEVGDLAHLRSLSLDDNPLTGAIPPELGSLSQLGTLSLAGTFLTSPIPPELGKLASLDSLLLGFSGLTGAIPPELGDLSNLKVLWLDQNSLTGTIPPELGDLSNLEALSIEANRFEEMSSEGSSASSTGLTGAIPAELGNLPNLEILRLSQNSLSGTLPAELGGLSTLQVLSLAQNELTGGVPPGLGRLASLEELNLSHNADLAGVLPRSLTALDALKVFLVGGTDLCAPPDRGFTDWLGRLTRRRVATCGAEESVVYLTQSVQSRTYPVPLVAGEPALLRVFVTVPGGSDARIPPVRARFYRGGTETHLVEIPEQTTAIPAEVDESALSKSANAEIPAEIVQPGLEMVIEIDPESTLDASLGIAKRIPAERRATVDVRALPPFELTVIPFLWQADPDSSVMEIGGADDDFFWATRTLLPVGEFEVDTHEPVFTSRNDPDGLLEETRAIRVVEGGTGYYLGLIAEGPDGPTGVAELSAPLAFAVADPVIAAHELGHTMGLLHAPCGGPPGDTAYPQLDGSIGAFGYDFREGGQLVPPSRPDLMSYCRPPWIGDYHFSGALGFRLHEEREALAAAAEPTRTILLWGGVDGEGAPFLEPAFVVDAPPALPRSGGEYKITGRSEAGGRLFELSFDMPRMADGDGRSSFAFALPVQPVWATALASITLMGPGGSVMLDGESDRPTAILRDPGTGRVLGIHRDPQRGAPARGGMEAALSPDRPGLETLFSRGIPGPAAWSR